MLGIKKTLECKESKTDWMRHCNIIRKTHTVEDDCVFCELHKIRTG